MTFVYPQGKTNKKYVLKKYIVTNWGIAPYLYNEKNMSINNFRTIDNTDTQHCFVTDAAKNGTKHNRVMDYERLIWCGNFQTKLLSVSQMF